MVANRQVPRPGALLGLSLPLPGGSLPPMCPDVTMRAPGSVPVGAGGR